MDAGNSGARADSGSAGAAGKPEDNQALTEEALHLKRIQVCPPMPEAVEDLTTTFLITPHAVPRDTGILWTLALCTIWCHAGAGNTRKEQAEPAEVPGAPKGQYSDSS